MPPLSTERLPGALIERFAGLIQAGLHEPLLRLLVWLSPVTVVGDGASIHGAAIALGEDR